MADHPHTDLDFVMAHDARPIADVLADLAPFGFKVEPWEGGWAGRIEVDGQTYALAVQVESRASAERQLALAAGLTLRNLGRSPFAAAT